jgi:predicted kinase
MRRLLADDVTDQSIHARVFETLHFLVRQRLAIGRPLTYVDATHLTPFERRPYIEIGREFGCEVEALFFDVPLEMCLARNLSRERVVPEAAIREMALKLVPPSVDEGFTRVVMAGRDPLKYIF